MLRKSNTIQAYKSLLFLTFAVLLELSTKLVSVAQSFAWLVFSSDQLPSELLIFFRAFELKPEPFISLLSASTDSEMVSMSARQVNTS